ncbi:MAG: FtsQ-type POTRA domain-containing protein [Terrisporobacter sp.]|uniref:cell division protein FtsQ/DivIB n=1 Tax=Terrisporobacter sp. TaxID=1965305 RepID=UPI002FC8E984
MRRRRMNTNKLMGILFFSLLIVFGICFFLKSDYFNLKEIVIRNNDHLSKGEVEKLVSINLNRNIFTYDLKEAKEKVKSSSYIKDCNIKREIPNKIIVTLEEKKIIGPIFNGKNYCLIDDKGNFIDEIKNGDEENLIINLEYTLKKNKINFNNKEDKEILLELVKRLEEENILTRISQIDMNEKKTVNMKTAKGLEICIGKNEELDKNINNLREVLVDLQNRKQYTGKIDMTYNDYVLYKP